MAESEDSSFEVDQLISEDEYEVEAVLDHRKIGSLTEYLVKWKDYEEDANTWEPASNLIDAQKIVDDYLESVKDNKATKKRARKSKSDTVTKDNKGKSDDDGSKSKKIKIVFPADALSQVSKKAKQGAVDDDADEAEFVDAKATGFESDTESESITKELKQTSLNGVFKKTYGDGLDRMDYKLENEDGVIEKIVVIVDERYPTDHADWENKVERIVVVIGKNSNSNKNDLKTIVKWNDGKYSLHSISDIRKTCPQLLIDYYHQYLLF